MSYVPIAAITAVIAATAAKKKRDQEEESMAGYRSDDLNGWEFKIVRANTRKFKNAQNIEEVKQQEAQTGWELVEKFDDYRLRFKRRIEKRSIDQYSETDPYRTQVGSHTGASLSIILGIILVLLGGIFFLFSRSNSSLPEFTVTSPISIIGIIVIIGMVLVAVVAIKRNS